MDGGTRGAVGEFASGMGWRGQVATCVGAGYIFGWSAGL